jgi:hypothetical protein
VAIAPGPAGPEPASGCRNCRPGLAAAPAAQLEAAAGGKLFARAEALPAAGRAWWLPGVRQEFGIDPSEAGSALE